MTHDLRFTYSKSHATGHSGGVQKPNTRSNAAGSINVFGVNCGKSDLGTEVLCNFFGQQAFELVTGSRRLLVGNPNRGVSI